MCTYFLLLISSYFVCVCFVNCVKSRSKIVCCKSEETEIGPIIPSKTQFWTRKILQRHNTITVYISDNAGRLFSCGADGTMKVRMLPERDAPPPHHQYWTPCRYVASSCWLVYRVLRDIVDCRQDIIMAVDWTKVCTKGASKVKILV